MNTLICYERCGTCKKAEQWLRRNGIEYEVRPIREENPSYEELKEWKERSGLPLKRFFNTSGQCYKAMGLKDRLKDMDGMLVKRPILIRGKRVLVGFKEEEWENVKTESETGK